MLPSSSAIGQAAAAATAAAAWPVPTAAVFAAQRQRWRRRRRQQHEQRDDAFGTAPLRCCCSQQQQHQQFSSSLQPLAPPPGRRRRPPRWLLLRDAPVAAAAAAAGDGASSSSSGGGGGDGADTASTPATAATAEAAPAPARKPIPPRLQDLVAAAAAAAAAGNGAQAGGAEQQQQQDQQQPQPYSLRETRVLVETAMLSAVSGLAFLLSTLLKLDNSLGYFLPLPIAVAACRSGVGAAWHTMAATAFLLLVLLGPLRAVTYVLMHGMLAASLGSMWVWRWPWAASIAAGACLRMAGQLAYLVLSSATMNENLFAVMLANVHNLLDRLSAALGSSGSASTLTIACMIFALLLVNGLCYCFLLHVVYHVILSSMGFRLGPVPGLVRRYLYAGAPPPTAAAAAEGGFAGAAAAAAAAAATGGAGGGGGAKAR